MHLAPADTLQVRKCLVYVAAEAESDCEPHAAHHFITSCHPLQDPLERTHLAQPPSTDLAKQCMIGPSCRPPAGSANTHVILQRNRILDGRACTRHSPHHICRNFPVLCCSLQDPRKRADANRVLQHEWMRENGTASERPLDNVILKRMRGFAAMNKLKKEALKVIAAGMTSEEIAGLRSMFQVGSQLLNLKLLARAREVLLAAAWTQNRKQSKSC